MHNLAGKFITFEGGEGAGKSTQISYLSELLKHHQYDVVCTREPGGAPEAEKIRKLILHSPKESWDAISEALLMFAARKEHMRYTILPALNRGCVVLCDRFSDSTMAYQGYAGGLGHKVIDTLYDITLGDFKPDLTLIFDTPIDISLKRVESRGESQDRFEQQGLIFHQTLRDAFKDIAAKDPQRCHVLDAGQSKEDVLADIAKALEERFLLQLSAS